MKPKLLLAGSTFVVVIAVGMGLTERVPAGQAAPGAGARKPANAAEFDEMFESVKNWGRWGKNDELGALNLITDAKRKQAIALARTGTAVSLAHDLLTESAPDNPTPFEHVVANGMTSDTFTFQYHGFITSHIDTLCHFPYKGMVYPGIRQEEVLTPQGCSKMGIQTLKNGIITRGILVDIPRLRGLPYLEPGTAVYPEDLEAWEKKAGVMISAGDAVLLRTGRWKRREELGPWDPMKTGVAGFHPSVAHWMKARDVALVGSDGPQDVLPSPVQGVSFPVHTLFLTAMGVNLLDTQDLEAVAETAAEMNRWEFMLVVAPLRVVRGPGSPVNALAVF